jgi:hypothetical protein
MTRPLTITDMRAVMLLLATARWIAMYRGRAMMRDSDLVTAAMCLDHIDDLAPVRSIMPIDIASLIG